jgi:MFS family permease
MAIFSLSGIPAMMVLLPIFGAHFGGVEHGAKYFGFLSGAFGGGALVGAILLARRRTVVGLGRMIGVSSLVYAAAIAAFALSPQFAIAIAFVPFAGWGMITSFASTNTILQTLVDDDKRGRLMSFFSMAFIGMTPFGVLMVGGLASHLSFGRDPIVGASRAILIAAAVCVAAAIRYWTILPGLRQHVRPIYIQRGILPQIAEGLKATDPAGQSEG